MIRVFCFAGNPTSDEEMLRTALAMSMDQNLMEPPATAPPATDRASTMSQPVDISAMTEEEQIAYALQMSMQTPDGNLIRSFQRFFFCSMSVNFKFLMFV